MLWHLSSSPLAQLPSGRNPSYRFVVRLLLPVPIAMFELPAFLVRRPASPQPCVEPFLHVQRLLLFSEVFAHTGQLSRDLSRSPLCVRAVNIEFLREHHNPAVSCPPSLPSTQLLTLLTLCLLRTVSVLAHLLDVGFMNLRIQILYKNG